MAAAIRAPQSHHLVRRAPIGLGLAGTLLLTVTALGLQAQDHSCQSPAGG